MKVFQLYVKERDLRYRIYKDVEVTPPHEIYVRNARGVPEAIRHRLCLDYEVQQIGPRLYATTDQRFHIYTKEIDYVS